MTRDKRIEQEHPGQGVAMFSHASSNGRPMFGSQLEHHYTCVRLSVSNAIVYHGGGEPERYLNKDQLIEIEFTADQFANLLSTHNVCPGTPCTIVRYQGKGVETPPVRKTNMHQIRDDFKSKLKALMKDVTEAEEDFAGFIDSSKKPMGKGKQRELLAKFRSFRMVVADSLPFAIDMFHEATQSTVSHAKQEVSHTLQTMLQQAGLRSMGEKQLLPPEEDTSVIPLQLEESSDGNS